MYYLFSGLRLHRDQYRQIYCVRFHGGSCWERQRHVVAIKVLVVDEFNERLKNYITYAGFGITILASLIACCCIFGGKKKGK